MEKERMNTGGIDEGLPQKELAELNLLTTDVAPIILSPEDQLRFAEALIASPVLSPALHKASRLHAILVDADSARSRQSES